MYMYMSVPEKQSCEPRRDGHDHDHDDDPLQLGNALCSFDHQEASAMQCNAMQCGVIVLVLPAVGG